MAVRGSADLAKLQNGFGGAIRVHWVSNIAVITMDRGENRMNDEFIDQMNAALDEALKNPKTRAIITTGRGKFFSNGLDLAWLGEVGNAMPDHVSKFLSRWHTLHKRVLTCPVPTLAAVNGHAYAGGGVLSLCHDYRVMQTGRGWWCLNEAHLGLQFPDWIVKMLRVKFGGSGGRALTEMVFGRRFAAEEAKSRAVVDEVCTPTELLTKAQAILNASVPADGLSRDFVAATKKHIYKDAMDAPDTAISVDLIKSRL